MKGRQLTLEEVLRLDDGTKVWVEDSRWGFDSVVCVFNKNKSHLEVEDRYYTLRRIELYDGNLEFYEWIDEGEEWSFSKLSESFDTTFELGSYNIISMATEICNLRGIDLTDDNIDKIMKEFAIGENR